MGLSIVPKGLRRLVFRHYHAEPSGGHVGEYNTIFCIRMRFWWPGIRNDVKNWVKICGQYIAHVTTHFYIMHVHVWMHGKLVDDIGYILQVMNCMCNLT